MIAETETSDAKFKVSWKFSSFWQSALLSLLSRLKETSISINFKSRRVLCGAYLYIARAVSIFFTWIPFEKRNHYIAVNLIAVVYSTEDCCASNNFQKSSTLYFIVYFIIQEYHMYIKISGHIYIYIYISYHVFLSENVTKYNSTTRRLRFSYVLILTNLLRTDNETESVKTIYN